MAISADAVVAMLNAGEEASDTDTPGSADGTSPGDDSGNESLYEGAIGDAGSAVGDAIGSAEGKGSHGNARALKDRRYKDQRRRIGQKSKLWNTRQRVGRQNVILRTEAQINLSLIHI